MPGIGVARSRGPFGTPRREAGRNQGQRVCRWRALRTAAGDRGYVPEVDATVVTGSWTPAARSWARRPARICASQARATPASRCRSRTRTGRRTQRAASCGSGAALAAGDCEMALGGDQGGSIRMPGAWCGVYGLKPTHGLVPYTGIMPIELTIDQAHGEHGRGRCETAHGDCRSGRLRSAPDRCAGCGLSGRAR